jgi:integrating conjugative element membrane protein (TIGR03747 family)
MCAGFIGESIIETFIEIAVIILIRLCLFVAFIPFMFVIIFVLIIDGLAQRDKRKFQGARESTFLFHRLKPLAKLSFFFLFFIYMVFPYMVMPELFLMPMVILSSLFMMLTIKSFKKYL